MSQRSASSEYGTMKGLLDQFGRTCAPEPDGSTDRFDVIGYLSPRVSEAALTAIDSILDVVLAAATDERRQDLRGIEARVERLIDQLGRLRLPPAAIPLPRDLAVVYSGDTERFDFGDWLAKATERDVA